MRKWINLFEAAGASFRLHPSLDPSKYQLGPTMRNVSAWRAYSYHGFEGSKPEYTVNEGDMAPVGYVMISLTDNTIVPISRGDEHHRGYDLLHDLKINARDFLPIFALGNNYIYSQEEAKDLLTVATKYLSYGGPDRPLIGTQDLGRKLTYLSDFVRNGGNFVYVKGKLAPIGQMFYDRLVQLAQVFRECRASESVSAVGKASREAAKFCKEVRPYLNYFKISDEQYAILYKPEIVRNLAKGENPIQSLEEAFFGFHGFKNAVHVALRECAARQKTGQHDVWKDDDLVAFWGDISLAIDMLGRI